MINKRRLNNRGRKGVVYELKRALWLATLMGVVKVRGNERAKKERRVGEGEEMITRTN